MADRIKYSQSQLEKYYDRIALPASDRQYNVSNLSSDAQLEILFRLQNQQLITVPFENLTLHYSWHRVVNVDADHLYDKIVGEKRGGYCMENNSFFHTVLLSLGYDVYTVAARVYNPNLGRYGGMTHLLNVITIGETSYAVDVGFGARTPTIPLQLIPEQVRDRSDSGQMRLRYDTIPQYLNKKQKVWIYEYRSRDGAEWTPQWCFMDFEALPEDIRVMNMSPSKSPSSFFTYKVVCVLFTSENGDYSGESVETRTLEEAGGDIDGGLIIDGNVFKYRKGGVVKWEQTFKTEEERLEALRKYFGVELSRQDQKAIRGTAGAIA